MKVPLSIIHNSAEDRSRRQGQVCYRKSKEFKLVSTIIVQELSLNTLTCAL